MKINDVLINYIDIGNNKGEVLIFLHGWGQNIEMMMPLVNTFLKTNRIIILDLPGFGGSSEPTYPWKLDEYVEMLKEFLTKLNVSNPILIGHSFGGKISLLFASKYNTKKLILLASPFRGEVKRLSLKTKILKQLKKVPLLNKLEGIAKKHMGSTDYKNSSNMMRQVLVNHVNEDISNKVVNINTPTIIIWGTNDITVSINEAYELEKLIKDSAVIELSGTHYAYLENLEQTINIINSFINSKE